MNIKQWLMAGVLCWVAGLPVAGFAQKPTLRFKADKTFKIVQFTDLHVKHQDPRSEITFERVKQVVTDERPDLVILTGDVIFSPPAIDNMRNVLQTLVDLMVPFATVFGNHDDEQGATKEELLQLAQSMPYCLTADEEPAVSGVGNYVLPVLASKGDQPALTLYCIDSNAYSSIEGVKGYDYIKRDQIDWYARRSSGFTAANSGKPLPALAFFHIPLPEYNQAASDENAQSYGIRREKACAPALNSGLFTTMKEQGDVMGVFVGHDHDDDYAVCWQDVLLAYGRYTGGNTVYNHLPNGARVIQLTEGERSFKTWIRTAAGVEQVTTYPDSYRKD